MKKETIEAWILDTSSLDLRSFMQQLEFYLLVLRDQLDLFGRKCIREVTSRDKGVSSTWDKIKRERLDIREPKDIFTKIDDLAGVRVMCYNLKDVRKIVGFLRGLPTVRLRLLPKYGHLLFSQTCLQKTNKTLIYSISKHENKITNPSIAGYRAYHLYLKFPVEITCKHQETFAGEGICEVQVRTLAQDMWGTLSHRDFYKEHETDIPETLRAHMRLMSDQLHVTDQTADLIKKQIDQEKTTDSCRKRLSTNKIQDVLKSLGFKDIKPLEIKTLIAAVKIGNINTVSELKGICSDPDLRRLTKEAPKEDIPGVDKAEVRPFVTQCVLGCILKATGTNAPFSGIGGFFLNEVRGFFLPARKNWPRYIRLLGTFW